VWKSLWGLRLALLHAAVLLLVSAAGAATVVLQWTAPGDDGTVGTAAAYDLRYSLTPITAENFAAATQILPLPPPQPAGSTEEVTATALPDAATLWFALRSRDEAFNWSPISNIAQMGGVADVGPGAVLAARFSSPWPSPARERTTFGFTLPEPAAVQLEVLDISGRFVRMVAMDRFSAGEFSVTWDLRDRFGLRVSPGVYFARAAFLGQQFIRRVVVLK
jgi:hypothetical protein